MILSCASLLGLWARGDLEDDEEESASWTTKGAETLGGGEEASTDDEDEDEDEDFSEELVGLVVVFLGLRTIKLFSVSAS